MAFVIKATGYGSQGLANRNECLRAFKVFFEPHAESRHMLQALPSARLSVVDATDWGAAIGVAEKLSDESGLYFTFNPSRDKGHPADKCLKDENIWRRRWVLIDVDRDLDKVEKGLNATDDEKAAVMAQVGDIEDFLQSCGWPCPVLVDSGNGYHIYYAVDLPNDAAARELVKSLLYGLSKKFDRAGISAVDRSCHDAKRIAKLPGSWARKSQVIEGRPHRPCQFIWVPPDGVDTVPRELLEQTVKELAEGIVEKAAPFPDNPPVTPAPMPKLRPFVLTTGAGTSDRKYVKAALDRECAMLRMTGKYRNNALAKASYKLGGFVREGLLTAQEVEDALVESARACGLMDDPNDGPKKTISTIRRCLGAGTEKQREIPPNRLAGQIEPKPSKNGKHEEKPRTISLDRILISAASVTPKRVEWLWPNRIPLGKLTTFAGLAGLGKSFVLCDIAARISRGSPWPFCGGECAPLGRSVIISGEDDIDDTLVPRLISCGADLHKIDLMAPEAVEEFFLGMKDVFKRIEEEVLVTGGPPLRMVVIDPPTSFLGGNDENSNAEVRACLGPIKAWAEKAKVAVVMNTHFNKASGARIDAMSRVLGSVAWVNKSRAAHGFARDEDDPTRVVFVPLKANVGRLEKALCYTLVDSDFWVPKVDWICEADKTAEEIVGGKTPDRFEGGDIEDALIQMFNEQREWPSKTMDQLAKQHGISKYKMTGARKKLMIRCSHRDTPSGEQYWFWWVPPDWKYMRDDDPPTL